MWKGERRKESGEEGWSECRGVEVNEHEQQSASDLSLHEIFSNNSQISLFI